MVDILGRVQIAVMVLSALWTIPLPNTEREPVENVATAVAAFAAGEEAVHNPQLPAVSFAFVFEHSAELPEAGIGDRLGQATVFHHSPDVQIFDADPVVSTNQIGGHFIQVVLSGVSNVLLYLGNADALPVPHAATFHAAGENPLCLSEASLVFARMLRVGDSLVVAGSCQPVYPKVNANRFTGRFELGKLFVQNQRDEISSAGSFCDCDGRWFRLELAAPIHVEAAQPGDNQIRIVGIGTGEPESGSRVFGGLLVPLLFEDRILGFLIEKLHEGVVQVPKGLLHWNAGDLAQPRGFFLAFPLGEFSRGLVVANSLLSFLPGVSTIPQCPVVDIPAAPEDLGKLCLLGYSWRKPELVSHLHTNSLYA